MTKIEEALSWLVISNADFEHIKDHEYELGQMGIEHNDRIAAFLRYWPSKLKQQLINQIVGRRYGNS